MLLYLVHAPPKAQRCHCDSSFRYCDVRFFALWFYFYGHFLSEMHRTFYRITKWLVNFFNDWTVTATAGKWTENSTKLHKAMYASVKAAYTSPKLKLIWGCFQRFLFRLWKFIFFNTSNIVSRNSPEYTEQS